MRTEALRAYVSSIRRSVFEAAEAVLQRLHSRLYDTTALLKGLKTMRPMLSAVSEEAAHSRRDTEA